MESARVDVWLWSIRVYKSRSTATAACRGGHVKVNGEAAKAATPVRVGDRVDVSVHGERRNFEVVRVIAKRVGAPTAAECFIDHSPPRPAEVARPVAATRERGAGRPTKRDRRQIDRLRGR